MNELINTGVELMLLGMGSVFVFLVLLIFATSAMSKLVLRFQPAAPSHDANIPTTNSANPAVDERTLKVIAEAIKQHRAS